MKTAKTVKTTIKTELKSKKSGEETTHKAISKSLNSGYEKATTDVPKTFDEVVEGENREDVEAQEEVSQIRHEFKIQENADQMTLFLRKKHNLPGLNPSFRYFDSRFPQEASGRTMGVSRIYHSLKLCVDNIPANLALEKIMAKKWGVEQAGFKYVWKQEGEVVKVSDDGKEMYLVLETTTDPKKGMVEKTEDFWLRQRKVKEKPAFTYNNTPFSFAAPTYVTGVAHA